MTATEFLHWVDVILEKSLANSVHPHCCKKGCHHCCYEAAYADGREIDHIVEDLTLDQRERVAARTKTWIEQTAEVRKEIPINGYIDAFHYLEQKIPCPLLESGLCMVYDRRPMSCREHFAIGSPDDCLMPNRRHQKYAIPDKNHGVWRHLFSEWFAPPLTVTIDHIGVHLAQRLLGEQVESSMTQRMEFVTPKK